MADFNVDSLNYNEAHKYYIAYYTNSGSSDMQAKGKKVSESKTWAKYISKWQSEDSTTYDIDGNDDKPSSAAQKEINSLEQNGAEKSKKGGVGSAIAGAAEGAAMVGASIAAMTGSLPGAIIYAAVSAVFLSQTIIFQQRVKQNRDLQDNYIKAAEKDLMYDYESAQAKAQEISDVVVSFHDAEEKIAEKAENSVGLSNAVANATVNSNGKVNISALGEGDSTAGAAYDELNSINNEMLDTIGEYDQVLAEVNTSKSIVSSIKDEMPQFQKQRKNDKMAMDLYAYSATAAIAPAAIGLVIAFKKIWLAGAGLPIVALLITGMALCGVAAVFAFMESGKQKNALTKANESADNANKVYNSAKEASGNIRSKMMESNAMYQNGIAIQEDMDKEDSNHNGGPV